MKAFELGNVRLQIIIQLSAILTKLCHIKCDHPSCVSSSTDGGHFEHNYNGGRAQYGVTSSKLQVIE